MYIDRADNKGLVACTIIISMDLSHVIFISQYLPLGPKKVSGFWSKVAFKIGAVTHYLGGGGR